MDINQNIQTQESKRCMNCGGYEVPENLDAVPEVDIGCECEGDYRPDWKRREDGDE